MEDIELVDIKISIINEHHARLIMEEHGVTTYGVGNSVAQSIGLAILAAADWQQTNNHTERW